MALPAVTDLHVCSHVPCVNHEPIVVTGPTESRIPTDSCDSPDDVGWTAG